MAGTLLLQGPENHWLIEPVAGYPQYIKGYLATDGTIPQSFYDNFLQFGPREDRLQVVDLLLGLLPPVKGLGKFTLFKKCTHCRGYMIDDQWVYSREEFKQEPGLHYVEGAASSSLASFLRPGRGICMGH